VVNRLKKWEADQMIPMGVPKKKVKELLALFDKGFPEGADSCPGVKNDVGLVVPQL
jgi:hypothetical protein